MSRSINALLEGIEKEIIANKDQSEKTAQLERLQTLAKIYDGEDKIISSFEIVETLKTRGEEPKFFSGIKGLDNILKGFREKQLVVISALQKSGKTSFCVELTNHFKDFAPVWFPFEESAEELIIKFLERNQTPPLFYTPKTLKGDTVAWIEERIIESIAKFNSKIVFIDHLDFIVPFGGDRHDLKVAETMRALKGICKRLNVIVFIIAHVKKTRMDANPTTEDIRGSASISQEADTVIMLWRQTKKGRDGELEITNNVNVSVQANRRTGSTGNVKMQFIDGRFLEEEWYSPIDDF